MKISSLNCRSLKKHQEDIMSDAVLLKSDIICLQETWLENDKVTAICWIKHILEILMELSNALHLYTASTIQITRDLQLLLRKVR